MGIVAGGVYGYDDVDIVDATTEFYAIYGDVS
jgi:hypothetical protein